MFGARKRIGYISPSVLELVPFDFYRFAPEGIGLVGVTCNIDDWTKEHFERALGQVKEAAGYLGARGVDYIIHGGGPLVVARGKGYEDVIVADITAIAKVPATTGVRSGVEALKRVGARRIAIASPYPDRHNAALSAYLVAYGFEVVRAEGKDLPFKTMQSLPPADIHAFAAGVLERAGGCDALYLPCPQWQAAPVVDALEREHGLPVVSYTHAVFFSAFAALGIRDRITGHGRLMASLAEAA